MNFLAWLTGRIPVAEGTALEARLRTLNPYTDPYACTQAMDSAADALAAQRAEIVALNKSLRLAHELNAVLQS